jgi:hypothetical protein
LFDLFTDVEAKGNVFGHPRGQLRKQHHVRIGNSQERVAQRFVVEANGLEQMPDVAARRHRLSDFADGTSENCGGSGNGAAPWCCLGICQGQIAHKILAQSIIVQGSGPVLASVSMNERGAAFH